MQCVDTRIGCVGHPPAPTRYEQGIYVPPTTPLPDLSPLGLPKLSPPKERLVGHQPPQTSQVNLRQGFVLNRTECEA